MTDDAPNSAQGEFLIRPLSQAEGEILSQAAEINERIASARVLLGEHAGPERVRALVRALSGSGNLKIKSLLGQVGVPWVLEWKP